ncbi:MAG: hypothetical protein Q9167_002607 [Letrouitia subvulpina]
MDSPYRINFTGRVSKPSPVLQFLADLPAIDYGAFRPRNARRCTICRARYKKSDRDVPDHCGFPTLLPCGDLICRLCIAHRLVVRKQRDCPVCRREFFAEVAGEVVRARWVEEYDRYRGHGEVQGEKGQRYDGTEAQERAGASGRGISTEAEIIEDYPLVGSPMGDEEDERREMEELVLEMEYTCQDLPGENPTMGAERK